MATTDASNPRSNPLHPENALSAVDAAFAALARAAIVIERARAKGSTIGHWRKRASAANADDRLATAQRRAGRATVTLPELPDDQAAVVGRIVGRDGLGVAGLTVTSSDERGAPLESTQTDRDGNFRFMLARIGIVHAARSIPATDELVPVGHLTARDTASEEVSGATMASAHSNVGIRLGVRRGNTELFRDAKPFVVAAGASLYRELIITG